jgi:two-component system, cell cycle sensor histidine kinase DivJ
METVLLSGAGVLAIAGPILLVGARLSKLRRANHALVRQNRELQQASDAKDRFVAKLSHELRNPLSAVLGFAELMETGRLGPLADGHRENIGLIRDSTEHVLTLVDELLDLARIEAGHLRLEAAPVEPAAIISACVSSLAPMADARGVRVRLDAPRHGVVLVDPTRLRQVVLNFASNAIKFTPAGGHVTVRLAREPSVLRLEVCDDGLGIAPEDQPWVFEEFFQLPGRERSGSGLGLSVTKRIVEAQGGSVELQSSLGQGSTFTARLPVSTSPSLTAGIARACPRPLQIAVQVIGA